MFTQQELVAIIRICDAAVRNGGLEMAELALPIIQKIRQSAQSGQLGSAARPSQLPPGAAP
jgi:hypothetical protein